MKEDRNATSCRRISFDDIMELLAISQSEELVLHAIWRLGEIPELVLGWTATGTVVS